MLTVIESNTKNDTELESVAGETVVPRSGDVKWVINTADNLSAFLSAIQAAHTVGYAVSFVPGLPRQFDGMQIGDVIFVNGSLAQDVAAMTSIIRKCLTEARVTSA